MLEDFRKKQWELEKARFSGEEVKPEQEEQIKKLAEIIQYNPYVRDFLMAEFNLNRMIMEIQRIIASAVGVQLPEEESREEKDDNGKE